MFDLDGMAAKYPDGKLLSYSKPWYHDIVKAPGDLVMLATYGDRNPFTGEVYTPGDRLNASMGVLYDIGFSYAGGKVLSKTPQGIKFLVKFKIEQHHLLPKQFKQFFEVAGINIEEFKTPLTMLRHRGKIFNIHIGVHPEWNKMWKEFFAKNGFATKQEILEQLEIMMKKFWIWR
jgi:hypothetical protein